MHFIKLLLVISVVLLNGCGLNINSDRLGKWNECECPSLYRSVRIDLEMLDEILSSSSPKYSEIPCLRYLDSYDDKEFFSIGWRIALAPFFVASLPIDFAWDTAFMPFFLPSYLVRECKNGSIKQSTVNPQSRIDTKSK